MAFDWCGAMACRGAAFRAAVLLPPIAVDPPEPISCTVTQRGPQWKLKEFMVAIKHCYAMP
jgi:hypothetical protein